MKRIATLTACVFGLLLSPCLAVGEKDYAPRAVHVDVACNACHGDGPRAEYSTPEMVKCLKCHQSYEAVAARTAHLDQRNVNPHNSYHYGMEMDCMNCHRQHMPSYNSCNQCHDFSKWMKPTP